MQKSNHFSVEIVVNESKIAKKAYKCKQGLPFCHIGLVKDEGGILSTNQIWNILTNTWK